jgi:hypothetical protein
MFKRLNRLYEEIPTDGGQGSGEAPSMVPDAPAADPADDMWNEMLADDGDAPDATPAPKPDAEVPPPTSEPKAPESQPIVESKPSESRVPETTPAQAAPEPLAPSKPTEPTTPTASIPTAPPVDYAALRAQGLAALEKSYALPAEQATQLLTEPEVVLPKLAAQVHQAVAEQVLAQIQHMLPQAVTQISAAQVRESEAKQAFYGRWPELQGYEQQVLAAGAMFRQINPAAPKEQAIEAIGTLAMQALGLQRAQQQAAPAPSAAPIPKPFQPAGMGASGVRPQAPPPTVWDDMMQIELD